MAASGHFLLLRDAVHLETGMCWDMWILSWFSAAFLKLRKYFACGTGTSGPVCHCLILPYQLGTIYLSMASFDLSLRHVFLGSWPCHRLLGFVMHMTQSNCWCAGNDIGCCISSAVSCSNPVADPAHRSCISSVVTRVDQLAFLRPNTVIFSCFFSMIRCLWFAETNTHSLLAHL